MCSPIHDGEHGHRIAELHQSCPIMPHHIFEVTPLFSETMLKRASSSNERAKRSSSKSTVSSDGSEPFSQSFTTSKKDQRGSCDTSATKSFRSASEVSEMVQKDLKVQAKKRIMNKLQKEDSSFRLQFDKTKVVGRDSEKATLREALDKAQRACAMVSIEATSGSGKSMLAVSVGQHVPVLAQGKFLRHATESYTGFAQLSHDLAGKILERISQEELHKVTRAVSQTVADVLVDVFPGFNRLFPDPETMSAAPNMQRKGGQLHYAAREFFRVVTAIFPQLVLVVDDMQVRLLKQHSS